MVGRGNLAQQKRTEQERGSRARFHADERRRGSVDLTRQACAVRLELFSVRNFRSIAKAEKLPLGEFTVLLGPNNEGKSNILQAMVSGMQELSVAKVGGRSMAPGARIARRERAEGGYVWARDFPRHLQAS